MKNKKSIMIIAGILVAVLIIVVIANVSSDSGILGSYRENKVSFGSLTVGVSESGTVDIGTVDQTFDLDMSELTRVTTSNSNSSSSSSGFGGGDFGGGMMGGSSSSGGSSNAFGQMFSMGGDNSGSSKQTSDSKLVVESIQVAVGQEIKAGDVILTLESEGVEELKTELQENTTKASADLEALIADQELSKITADYTLEKALTYGDYAEKERQQTIASLKQDVTDAQENYNSAKEVLARYQEQYNTCLNDYNEAVTYMNAACWARDNADKYNQTYVYIGEWKTAHAAIAAVESLEKELSNYETRVKSAQTSYNRAESTLAKAKRAYDSGVISANQTYEINMLAYNTAQETYDITISYMEDNLAKQQKTYDETVSKWEEFNSYIDGVNILSEYSGVITSISVEPGDGISTGSTVITLYNSKDVTMTVAVSEDDMTDIEIGGKASVLLTAYPNDPFEATVSEISDASTDSSGNTTRDVTVTIKGDMSKLYQGMTGDVTFITKQVENVLYVSNRAIIRENGVSYVKIQDEKGNIKTVRVVTGFSDGSNVEIVEGLSEGQTVIIEKGDSK